MQKCFDISPLLICFLGAFTQLFSGCYCDCSLTLIKHDAILFFLLPSAVCDIGSASFKYDMRRLSEILAFPKAWYRRSIARRLFLGDQTINLPGELLLLMQKTIH